MGALMSNIRRNNFFSYEIVLKIVLTHCCIFLLVDWHSEHDSVITVCSCLSINCDYGAGTIHEMSCPSDGEEQAALYNMACAYAQLKQSEAALTCLEAVLESGFEDIAGLRTDPDLEPIRGVQFDSLVSKCVTNTLGLCLHELLK